MSSAILDIPRDNPVSVSPKSAPGQERLISFCAWTLSGIYALTVGWQTLEFEQASISLYKSAFIALSTAKAVTVVLAASKGILALLLLYNVAIRRAALASLFFATGSALFHAYVLWAGELEPAGCVGRALKEPETWEHPFLMSVGVLMIFLSGILYLTAGRKTKILGG